MRIAVAVYFVYLTILLFSRDPTRWVNTAGNLPVILEMLLPVAHLVSFTVLSFLAFAARMPMPKWGVLLLLALYGGATEIIQAAIPNRSTDWLDWMQDLGGILLGFVCFTFVVFLLAIIRKSDNIRVSTPS